MRTHESAAFHEKNHWLDWTAACAQNVRRSLLTVANVTLCHSVRTCVPEPTAPCNRLQQTTALVVQQTEPHVQEREQIGIHNNSLVTGTANIHLAVP